MVVAEEMNLQQDELIVELVYFWLIIVVGQLL